LLQAGFNPKTGMYTPIYKIGQSILQIPTAHFERLLMTLFFERQYGVI